VSSGTLRALLHEAARDKVVLPIFEGRQGLPLLLGAGLLPDVAAIAPGQGLDALWQRRPEALAGIEVADAGVLKDPDEGEG
jgi:molybdenum cofactor cytidylyltransferase